MVTGGRCYIRLPYALFFSFNDRDGYQLFVAVLRLNGGKFSPYFQISHGKPRALQSRGMKRRGCVSKRRNQPR
jgi:hypothetical protein